jgi:hypothetical protein
MQTTNNELVIKLENKKQEYLQLKSQVNEQTYFKEL